MAVAAASSSSYSSLPGWEHDVFLSFRGEDPRKTFVGHLYRALDQRGIRTFKDDEKLDRGKFISPELLKNINESNIAVVVFSKNYANLSWCLDELVEILQCWRTKGQIVLPIFYDVKPSQVRKQKRSFAEAFRYIFCFEGFAEAFRYIFCSQEMERSERRREALKEAANISGLDLEDAANGDEAEFVQQIVQEISQRLQPKLLKVADYEVGITSRANEVMMLLEDTSEDRLFVAICGIGGIGKTTVARAVFSRIYNQFERCCFLENVRAESKNHGLAKLQEKLCREILKEKNVRISNSDGGINEIKVRLQKKKILVVLDDVDDQNQLRSLVGKGHDCFGSGSRIIISTRDERVFINYNVKIYKAELLRDVEALELFSWHAFKQNHPVEQQYLKLSHCLKNYAEGFPLALKVLGSHLYKRDMRQWESVWNSLKSNPHDGIQGVLEISYDGLDKNGKSIFLDIACFFNGCEKKIAMDIFEGCGFHPVITVQVLIERYLITISNDKFRMHDLIQEMGREIVRRESKYRPEMQSRLWSYEDIYEVFAENKVTENIEAIMIPEGLSLGGADFFEGGLPVSADIFTKLKKLRILKISGMQLLGSLTYLSNELRYFEWKGYPKEYLPSSFDPRNLVGLNLSYSLIKGIGTNMKFLKTLKVLNLSYCKYLSEKNPKFLGLSFLEELYLTGCQNLVEVEFDDMESLKVIDLSGCENLKKTPNLSVLSCLEILNFLNCTSLAEVHPSIEFHERLVKLNFIRCTNLKSLAKRIHLKSLKSIQLERCSKLEEFPEIEGDMECLEWLGLSDTAIIELSPSVARHLKGLRRLEMGKCKMLEGLGDNIPQSVEYLKGLGSWPSIIREMKSLDHLSLSGSGIKKLPSSFAQLTQLKSLCCDDCNLDEESILNLPHSLWRLDLRGNKFASLPLFHLHTNLQFLYLDGCLSLQTLDSLPSSIWCVSAQGCSSLERYSIPKCEFISYGQVLNFAECHKLVVNDGNNKPNIYNSESELQGIDEIIVPGSEIPSWFSHTYESGSE